jgi:ribosome-binding factor A
MNGCWSDQLKKQQWSRRGNVSVGASDCISEEDSYGNREGAVRHVRLCELLREELDAVLRDDVSDPRLDRTRVAMVELSPDGRCARVHVVVPVGSSLEATGRALERATPFLRGRLTDAIELKFVPTLRFSVGFGSEEDGGVSCK